MNTIDGLPEKLEDWTYDVVVGLVKKYKDEPSIFDFKEVLNPTRQESGEFNASIRRTACSMANADGGFIIFGVLDRAKPASTLEARIPGIPLEKDLRKKFQEKIAKLQRPIYFDTIPSSIALPTDNTRGVYVVSIPRSQLRPHCDPTTGVFYRRGDGGNAEHMNFYEVREQMMYTEERLRKVTLFRLELAQHRKTAQILAGQNVNVVNNLLRFDTGAYKIILADICGFIPPASKLLAKLLDVPIYANLINERLSRESIPSLLYQQPIAERAQPILENLTFFLRLCQECEQGLEQIFGPLE